jgi:transposase
LDVSVGWKNTTLGNHYLVETLKRFTRWAKAGVWEQIFAMLMQDPKNQYLMTDSTIVRAHQQSAEGKGGIRTRRWGVPAED